MTPLQAQLIEDEAFRQFPYKDTVGKMTIGIGRNLDDVGITRNEALIMLSNDIEKVRYALTKELSFFKTLTPARQDALINMGFNIGVTKLLTFKKTLMYLSIGDYKSASQECLKSVWAVQVGERAQRISKILLIGS
ncbi:MAG: glycoside hydrolase family protein [Campylobacterales bacterium]|nr:glycoside hydrolase family protein [Campylobacterales bacterium]